MSVRLPVLCAIAVALVPVSVSAKSPADTRIRPAVTDAQKTPSVERHSRTIKCHHEASKATTCHGYNHMAEQRRQAAAAQLASSQ